MMPSLSIVIIAKNEERNIGRCLNSVAWADDIIVIDSQSNDATREIAQKYGARLFSPEWRGFGPAKREGVSRARHNWILSIDADEEVPPELKSEIVEVMSNGRPLDGYYIPRRTKFLGRWIRHCGWYPDYVLRLFNREAGNFNDAIVHERVVVNGRAGRLRNDLLHYSYPSLEEYFRKFDHYTSIGAEELYRQNVSAGLFEIVLKPPVSFLIHYVIRRGFLDGLEGFLVSFLSATAVMVKYAKLRELHRRSHEKES